MPAKKRLTMRQLRTLLRLKHGGARLSDRTIACQIGVARSTIQEYLARVEAAGLSWPLPDDLTDEALDRLLFPRSGCRPGFRRRVEPDWAMVARELKRPGVTLMTLWEEYRESEPEGYGYSRFCDLFRSFERHLSPVMRQHHVAGDKVFVDFSGKRLEVIDPTSGMVRPAEIFVGVLGASSYTYAEAVWTQTLPDWIGAHSRMFGFFGGVPRLVIPDNLKSGVQRANFYDPELNRSYGRMAEHYGVGILPARPLKPKDKAKVEAGVRVVQLWLLGRLRRQTFFSLEECNREIATALERLNGKPLRRLGVSRRELFDRLDRPVLNPLPETAYEYAEWLRVRVGLDYHVEVAGAAYSVPHALIRQEVEVRLGARTVEVFRAGRRVAAHPRGTSGAPASTLSDHMPAGHRQFAEWSAEHFLGRARRFGPATEALIAAILADRRHPEQGYRSCQGVLKLFRGANEERAEAVSARALAIGALGGRSIASILENNLDRQPAAPAAETPPLVHANIRGSRYFH
jgi:transposase